ncbi:MAG TPA: glutathione S-transferase N-terminal domain-containing protein [Polyangiaceae bacterium]|nr:glutathione S-transferase N-terminal domain-containing protein [Polyangiaceae bacterium]
MIDLYSWPTPNGWKITIMLEETGLPYRFVPTNILRGEQHSPEFLKISPNGRIPAIIDQDAKGGPLAIFESGAILIYLAEKSGKFMPRDDHGRFQVIQWVMWQMSGLGPMSGQASHFKNYAPERIPYAYDRYMKEMNRLQGVLNRRLEGREYIADDYSIADIACFPWILGAVMQNISIDEFPHLQRWVATMQQRPGVRRGTALDKDPREQLAVTAPNHDEEAKQILMGNAGPKKN